MSTTVFLSATFEDLEAHRNRVLEVLDKLKLLKKSMEYFGARSSKPLAVCLSEVRESDIYIGILGMRYGSVARDGKSFTELEYEEALAHKKTILIYLLDEGRHPVVPEYVDRGESAIRLVAFKEKLKSEHTCSYFRSPDHLAAQLAADLANNMDRSQHKASSATKSDLSHLLVEAGFIFSKEFQIVVPLEKDNERDGFRFGDKDLEALMAAAFLGQCLRNRKFEILEHFDSVRQEIWEPLIYFLTRSGLDQTALAAEILNCSDSLRLRLLIKIAGRLRAIACVEAICKRLFDRVPHQRIIQEFQIEVTPFNKVVEEALRDMPPAARPIIERYVTLAKLQKKWTPKRVLENGLKVKAN